jgi:hypothetical protein
LAAQQCKDVLLADVGLGVDDPLTASSLLIGDDVLDELAHTEPRCVATVVIGQIDVDDDRVEARLAVARGGLKRFFLGEPGKQWHGDDRLVEDQRREPLPR